MGKVVNQVNIIQLLICVEGLKGNTATRPRKHDNNTRSPEGKVPPRRKMIDDQDLGFFANFLGVFIFVLVIAYHFVMADPKFEGN
ncbi:Dolichyl-diphosphooligosaccharide--protein glycosyltransferase subunit 4A [Spatholobus suberectus]|nr:Dolichyl-diphosphooligosaccharide--protein glycosyltransferase subunit 4A [Spatholobus suberectus]